MNSITYLDTIKTAARSYVVTMLHLLKECQTHQRYAANCRFHRQQGTQKGEKNRLF